MFFAVFSALCEQHNETKNAVARKIGLSNSTVTKWKNTNATPSGSTLGKIAEHFGVSMDFLLGATPESYLLGSQYQLAQAEKAYAKETDAEKREQLALEIDGLRESIEDQQLAMALDDLRRSNEKKPTTIEGDGLDERIKRVVELYSVASETTKIGILAQLEAEAQHLSTLDRSKEDQ